MSSISYHIWRFTEIKGLIDLLAQHRALGTLEESSSDERVAAFDQRAGRQLLVALHEATLGRPFEDIIKDEYDNIVPAEAQEMYLTICVLNRLHVPVRAGLVARMHDIPFNYFEQRFFSSAGARGSDFLRLVASRSYVRCKAPSDS